MVEVGSSNLPSPTNNLATTWLFRLLITNFSVIKTHIFKNKRLNFDDFYRFLSILMGLVCF